MSNLPNNIDTFQRITDKTSQENVHKELHNDLAETLENVQKFSGSHHVSALPETSDVGHVYTLLQTDGEYQPGIYVCVAPDPVYLPLASRGEGYVKEFSFTDEKNISINHGLGSRGVFVKLFDASYNEIEYDEYQIVDENNVLIKLTNNTTGKVIMLAGGKDGMPPAHEWDGTRIRFKNPNGSWGAWVDLIAEIENKGDKGDTGPMPEHEWNGTSIRFKLDEDTWGAWVDLRGQQGLPGVGIPGEPGADGADGLSINWRGNYSALASYVVNDMVFYNGSSYICKLASTGNIPTNATYWDLNASKGADGSSGGTSRLELVAGEVIHCTGYIPASFSGTGFKSIKVGTDVSKLKTYSSKQLLGAQFYMRKVGTPIGPVTIELYLATGGVRIEPLIETVTFDASEVGTEFSLETFLFSSLLEANDQYEFAFSSAAGDESNYIDVIVEDYIEISPQSTPVYVGNDGRVYVSQDGGTRKKVDGFVDTPAVESDLVMVTVGGVQSNFNNLLPGVEYYLSTSLGQFTSDVRDVKVGKALTASSLLIQEEEIKIIPDRMLEKTSDGIGAKIALLNGQIAAKLVGDTPGSIGDFISILKPTTTPEASSTDTSTTDAIYSMYRYGQSFTVGSRQYLKSISFYLGKNNNPTGNLVARLYQCVAGLPVTEIASTSINANIINGSWNHFNFNSIKLESGQQYAVMLEHPEMTGSNYVFSYRSSSSTYSGGTRLQSLNGGVSFSTSTYDCAFKLYTEEYDKTARVGFSIDGITENNLNIGLNFSPEKNLISTADGGSTLNVTNDVKIGQTISSSYDFVMSAAYFWLRKYSSPTGNLNLDIYEADEHGIPFGPSLANAYIDAATLSTGNEEKKFSINCLIKRGKKYAMVMSGPTFASGNYVQVDYYGSGSQYSGGGYISSYESVWNTSDYDLKFKVDGNIINFSSEDDVAALLQSAIRAVTGRKEKVSYDGVYSIESSIRNKTSVIGKLFSPISGLENVDFDFSGNGALPCLNLGDSASIVSPFGDENSLMINDQTGNEQSAFIKAIAGEDINVINTPVPVYIESENVVDEAESEVFYDRKYNGQYKASAYDTSDHYPYILQPFDNLKFNSLKSAKINLRKVGTPTGNIYVRLYTLDSSDNPSLLIGSSSALDASTLATTFAEKTFTFSNVVAPMNSRLGVLIDCSGVSGSTGSYVQIPYSSSPSNSIVSKLRKKTYSGSYATDSTNYLSASFAFAVETNQFNERIAGAAYASMGEYHLYKNLVNGLVISSASKGDPVAVFVGKIKGLSDLLPGRNYFINNFFVDNQTLNQTTSSQITFSSKKGVAITTGSNERLIKKIKVKLQKSTGSTFVDYLIMNLYLADSNGLPTGGSLGSAKISANVQYSSYNEYPFEFQDPISVLPSTRYAVVIEHEGSSSNIYWSMDITNSGVYINWTGSAWANVTGNGSPSIIVNSNNASNISVNGGDIKLSCGMALKENEFLFEKGSGEVIKSFVPGLVDATTTVHAVPKNTKAILFTFKSSVYNTSNTPTIELYLLRGQTKISGGSLAMSITFNNDYTVSISGSYGTSGAIITGTQMLYCLN